MNDGEVFALDVVRESAKASNMRALIVLWFLGSAVAALAIWDRSIILGICSVLALALAFWWTLSKWRSWLDARRPTRD